MPISASAPVARLRHAVGERARRPPPAARSRPPPAATVSMPPPASVVGANGLQKAPSAVSVSSGKSSASPASTPGRLDRAAARDDRAHDVVGRRARRASGAARTAPAARRPHRPRRWSRSGRGSPIATRRGTASTTRAWLPGPRPASFTAASAESRLICTATSRPASRREPAQHPRREQRAVRQQGDGRDVGQPLDQLRHAGHQQRLAAGDAERVEAERRRVRPRCAGSGPGRAAGAATCGDEPVRQ